MKTTVSTVPKTMEDRFDGLTPSDLNDLEKRSLVSLAMALLTERNRHGQTLGSPDETRAFLRLRLADRRNEVFG